MFIKEFSDYACEGDTITCTVDGFDVVARLYRDDCSDKPDERDDGFWPSLDSKSAGYIGPRSQATLHRHMEQAKRTMQAWLNDEWFYCGVAVTVSRADVSLTGRYDHALWGVECNYPSKNKNTYLRTVANELLSEALEAARAKIAQLTTA